MLFGIVPLAPCVWVTPDAWDVRAACNGFISGLPPSTVYQRQSYSFAENANCSRCQALNQVQYAKYSVGLQNYV